MSNNDLVTADRRDWFIATILIVFMAVVFAYFVYTVMIDDVEPTIQPAQEGTTAPAPDPS